MAHVERASTHISTEDRPLPFSLDIDNATMNPDQQRQLTQLLRSYEDVFCKNDEDLGYTTMCTHKIPTHDERPVCMPHGFRHTRWKK